MEQTSVDVTAASSPAPIPVEKYTSEQRSEWLKTGKSPEPPKKQESAPVDPPKEATSEPKKAEPVTESEPVTEQDKPSRAQKRILELLAKTKELERKLQEKEPTKEPVKEAKTDDAPKKPKIDDFDTYEAYEAAKDEYSEKLAEFKAKKAIEDFKKESEKTAREAEVAKQNKAIEETWKKRVEESTKKHADWAEVAGSEELDKAIKAGSVLDSWILESEHGAELLYHFGQNVTEVERLNGLAPFHQVRELVKIESQLAEGKPAPKKVTSAKEPVHDIQGKTTAVLDEAAEAVKRGDFAAYSRIKTAQELKARKA